MRRLAVFVVCVVAFFLPRAAAAEPAPSPQTGAKPSAAVARPVSRQSAEAPPKAPAADRWRYQFHNGHWWHWGKSGEWSYWTGTRWVKYSPASYRRWYAQWRIAQNEAEIARLKTMLRSLEKERHGRPAWVRDPDSYFPFANERGGYR